MAVIETMQHSGNHFIVRPCPMLSTRLTRISGSLLLMVLMQAAQAKIYYIDALNGNDAWTGTAAAAGKNDGPWQTLANLAPANRLKPGDQVLLRCGQQWGETLRIESSGTAESPIRVGSYPASCADKPAIVGAKRIPAEAWTLHAGNIYKARLPVQLLVNGMFDSSFSGWRRHSPNNDASMAIESSCPASAAPCLAFTSGSVGSSLLISNPFKIESYGRYRVTFSVRAPAGTSFGAYVRRFSAPWNTIGLSVPSMPGNGDWQTVALSFTSTTDLDNARLDIQVNQPGRTVYVRDVRVERDEQAPTALAMVTENGIPQLLAHHPNRGYNPVEPNSLYLLTLPSSTFSLPNGRRTSDHLVTGSDLVLPEGAALEAGLRVVLRSQAWSLAEHTVTRVEGNRVFLNPNAAYPLSHPGWGYYLTGALWMLDSPREWHYDNATQTLYVWSEGHPGDRFAYSTLERGIDIGRRNIDVAHIVIEDIAVRNVRDGLYVQRSKNLRLSRLEIDRTARYGVDGEGTINLELSDSRIATTGSDALFGPAAEKTLVRNNDILDSGVTLDAQGKPNNLPLPNYGALHASGLNARIIGNRVRNAAFIGISTGNDSEVRDNAVLNFCYLLNDCAGIYLGGTRGAKVIDNLVSGGAGDRAGTPRILNTLVDALYLDGGASNTLVSGNTLAGGDYAIQLHNGNHNRIERNTLYGSRANLLWLQETGNDRRAAGNLYDNVVADNAFFPTTSGSALTHAAKVENTADFALYHGNIYSTLISPVIAVESAPGVSRSYQFADWQAAKDGNGNPRNLDATGRVAAPLAGFARGLLGGTLVVNGNLTDGAVGWSRHNTTAPAATLAVQSCPPAGNCLMMTAGGSNTTLSTPRFGVAQGQWYRVSFDAQVGEAGQILKVQAIRSGPDSYASVMGAEPIIFSGSTTLRRYQFVFQATATVARTATQPGVRVDFMDVKSGQTLRIANFEVVPLMLSGDSADHALLLNPERYTSNAACPVESTDPAQCTNYYLFPQGDKAVWPITLAPLASQIVFRQDTSLMDTDRDGVADTQDACPGTSVNAPVNARGCALGQ